MSRTNRLTVFFISLISLTLLAPCAWARMDKGEATVYAIGTSKVVGKNMSATREAAVEAGLVAAVSTVLTELMPPESVAGNFQVLNERVLNRTDQYVRDYKVMTESSLSNTYRLMVRATVSVDRIKDALKSAGIHLGEVHYPKVLLCLAEKGGQDETPRYWWGTQSDYGRNVAEAPLSKALIDKGFRMVQPVQGAGGDNMPAALDVTQAQALGRKLAADVVVVAMADSRQAGTAQGSIPSFRATVTAKAYGVSSGQLLAQVNESAVKSDVGGTAGSREALLSAAGQAGATLAGQLDSAWSQQAAVGKRIDVVITGVGGNIASFVKFRGALSNTSGVDSLQLNEMMGDRAVLAVAYQGDAQTLADAIRSLSFDTFGINIEKVAPGSIQMQLMPR